MPGNANPAEAAGKEGRANRQAVNPNQKGANAAPEVGNPGDNSDNNGMAKDDTGNNPASGRGSNTITNPGTAGTVQWFWIALALIVGVVRGLTVYFFPPAAEASMYLLMLLVLLVKPTGLTGRAA